MRMDHIADEPSGAEAAAAGGAGPGDERLRIVATVILGMVVKGLDLERRDLIRLGYGERLVYRALRSLRKARVIKKVTRRSYAFRNRALAEARRLAAEDMGRPVGWPSIHNFLFVAYGMFDWDEGRMDAFLAFLKEDWLHRMRGSGRPLERPAGRSTEGAKREGEGEERMYNLREASEILGLSASWIRKWEKRGKIHCVRDPLGWRRVPESEIIRLQEARLRDAKKTRHWWDEEAAD